MARNIRTNPKAKPKDEKRAFSLLFKNHPVPMYVCDLKTLAILEVNDAAVEKYHYPRDEFQALTFKDVVLSKDEIVLPNNEDNRRQDPGNLGVLLHKCKNGEYIKVNLTSHIIKFNGRDAALVMTQDVAGQKDRGERSQPDSDIELHALFASMQDLVLVIDREGFYRKVAPTNTRLLIRPQNELIGRNLRDFFSDDMADFFLKSIKQVLATRQSAHIEYEIAIANHSTWFAASISPMDQDNTLWVVRDITENKLTNKALRESEERYRSLFDRMMDGIYLSTHEGKFVDVNPAMVSMFGYASKDEMLEMDIKTELYFDIEERGTHKLDTGQGETDIYRLRRKDGAEIWVEDRSSYIYDDQGNITFHEGTLRDVTARKQAEEDLQRAKASLEKTNRELERVLLREQQLARTDGLTGLYNYRYFFELASREFKTSMRYRRPLAVLMFDTDNFKKFNDTLGHFAGDRILASVAQATASQMRSVDILARYGGDEFIILLPHTSAKHAFSIAERIRNSVAAMSMATEKGPMSVTLSIGIAEICYEPADGSVEYIVQRADKALYSSKQAGRNRATIFEPPENGAN